MNDSRRTKTQLTVELMRRGAVMIKEPCPIDNGVQLRYKGKVYCTVHDNLESVLQAKELSLEEVVLNLRNLLLVKIREETTLLESEKDQLKLNEIVTLMSKYIELLNKLGETSRQST